MVKYLINLFSKKSKCDVVIPTIPTPTQSTTIPTVCEFNYYIKNDLKVIYKLGVNDRVIVVSNEPNGVLCGTLVEFDEISMAKNIVPVIQKDGGGLFISHGILIPFEQDLYDKLLSLSTDHSAWNYVSPSWAQLSDSTVYRKTEDSIILKNLK